MKYNYDCAYYICDVFWVLEIIKSAAQKKYSNSDLVDNLKFVFLVFIYSVINNSS
jgi:hypothetical protein